jgi:hypothetical protein
VLMVLMAGALRGSVCKGRLLRLLQIVSYRTKNDPIDVDVVRYRNAM